MYKKGLRCQIKSLGQIYIDTFGYKEDGYFVEVGAFDGIMWSNTSGLLYAGWHGVYFEPQSEQFNNLSNNLGSFHNATLINKAISDFRGLTTLYLGGSVSTINREMRDNYLGIPEFASTGHSKMEFEIVEVSTLDIELSNVEAPIGFDVIVIDVEGSEMNVLYGFSIHKWKPQMVIIEAREKYSNEILNSKAKCINEYMHDFGYEKIYSDYINNIYTRR
jgi:FkbM family methyltransferase